MPGFKTQFCALLLLGAIIAAAMPADAADFRLRRTPQSAAAPPPAQPPGHVSYIRRLMRDAEAAAARGDAAAARRLAERAHKIAVTYKSSLANTPDCTPEATLALAQKFGSTTGSPPKKSSAEPSAAPPAHVVAKSPARELDILSMTDPKSPAQQSPAVRTSEPAAAERSPTRENRLVSTSTARQQPRPGVQPYKSEAVSQQSRPGVQASPAIISRPVARTAPKASQPPPRESISDKRQRVVSRSSDAELEPRTVAKRQGKSPRSSAHPAAQPISDPEVQSAIGNGDAQDWDVELNIDEDAEDVPAGSPDAQLPPAPPAEEISRTRPVRPSSSPSIGVWSPGNETRPTDAALPHAVSLPAFLSPDISPVSRDVESVSRDRGTQFIETDFRRPVHSESPRVPLQESVSPRPAALSGPAIRVREEPAVQWPTSATQPTGSKYSKAEPLPLGSVLPKGATERLVLVIGIALLVGGCALFGLSFRRT